MAERKYVYNDKVNKRDQAWKKEHMTRVYVRFHNINDADIIEKLNSVPSKNDYIRQLIRADINKNTD